MRCECGHYLGANVPTQMQCLCGREVLVCSPPVLMPSYGEYVRQIAPDLFCSTSCRERDALKLLNSMGDRAVKIAPRIAELLGTQDVDRLANAMIDAHAMIHSNPIDLSKVRLTGTWYADTTAVITFHFNPCGYDRQRETFYEWLPSLGDMPVHCYELVFDADEPEIEGSRVVRASRSKSLMFQKEALFNLALSELPQHIDNVVWADHDIILDDSDWIARSVDLLNEGVTAVQPWQSLGMLDNNRIMTHIKYSAASRTSGGSPGGVWVAKRSFLDSIGGLYPYNIVGGGDVLFLSALTDDDRATSYLARHQNGYGESARRWIDSISGDCRSLPIRGYHLWHGSSESRQYRSRENILSDNDFDPGVDVRHNADGVLEWSSDKPDLHRRVREYFIGRDEDA